MDFGDMMRRARANKIARYGRRAVEQWEAACERYQLDLANHNNVALSLLRDEQLGAQPSPPPKPPRIEDFAADAGGKESQ